MEVGILECLGRTIAVLALHQVAYLQDRGGASLYICTLHHLKELSKSYRMHVLVWKMLKVTGPTLLLFIIHNTLYIERNHVYYTYMVYNVHIV